MSTMLGSNEVDKTFFLEDQGDMNVKVMKDIVCALEQAVTARLSGGNVSRELNDLDFSKAMTHALQRKKE